MLETTSSTLHQTIFNNGALNGYYVVLYGEIYRLFSAMFLHNDIMHIVMNMLSLYMVGGMVERLFTTWGYLGIYFMSAFLGSFASIYMHPIGWAVGASGAIFGIFGALAGFAFIHRTRMHYQFMQFMRSFGVVLAINFFIGIIFPSIDMSAHIGGLLAGFIGGIFVAKNSNYLAFYLVGMTLLLLALYNYYPTLYVAL
jgi:rhomboid protease GluP